MQSLRGSLRLIRRHSNNGLVNFDSSKLSSFDVCRGLSALVLNSWVFEGGRADNSIRNLSSAFHMESGFRKQPLIPSRVGISRASLICGGFERPLLQQAVDLPTSPSRCFSTATATVNSTPETAATPDISPRIKFKRLDKTAKHIMQAFSASFSNE
ncbi:hypothetical protein RJ641_014306 [Dillenia turbinata]|uniref:Uncharacterized protein n=1 Tax=Dillenia turbinata TaxID=194707 RepID=A0AAN8Z4S4_9MAGN